MRVRLSKENQEKLFKLALVKNKTWNNVSSMLGKSTRILFNWRQGKTSMPITVFEHLIKNLDINKNEINFELLSDFWHTKKAGNKGALARMKLYGNFGTFEGRRKGGMASLNTHQKIKSDFKTLQIINKPKLSELLAEFLGILFGDGHLSEYQVSITTNAATDKKHAIFIKSLIRKLFQITPTLKIRKNDNTAVVVASSKMLVNILNNLGMPTGNKIQNHLTAPRWIFKNKSYQKAFLRGLFDTDGCIYLDKHQKNNYLGWTITSYANNLVNDIIIILKKLHFSPTHRTTQKSIFLRRQKEIMRYFTEIGTSNQKHYNRYKKYIGRVPKRS